MRKVGFSILALVALGAAACARHATINSRLGVPIYPGAQEIRGVAGFVTLKSSDPFDKVYRWYRSQLPANASGMVSSSVVVFTWPATGRSFIIERKAKETDIAIDETTPAPGTAPT
jgi:hypothetical protein